MDIADVPLSFNVGVNDHLELFFKTTGYRGIKVNNPRNLSSFYLPNSQLKSPHWEAALRRCGARRLTGPATSINGTAVFRPAFNQPFVQFPFVGVWLGLSGQVSGYVANPGDFGCPGVMYFTLGVSPQGNIGSFSSADNFPGIGSPVGGILRGIVLHTQTLPATFLTGPITVPVNYTVAPAYLPDAPFVNRLYGESSFNNLVFGAKWRFTGPNNPLGVGIIPFYRWWMDKGDDFYPASIKCSAERVPVETSVTLA